MYTVLNQGDSKEKGYVERTQNPGVRIDTFTQLEVDQGLIAYVHRGGDPSTNTRLALQVRAANNKIFLTNGNENMASCDFSGNLKIKMSVAKFCQMYIFNRK